MDRLGNRAVVIGASMAGLPVGRVLADRYKEVVIIDRDTLPDQPRDRKGVPQGRHVHALLPGGLRALEELFPGFGAELRSHGGILDDFVGSSLLYGRSGRMAGEVAGLQAVRASRALQEYVLRERTQALPGVSIVESCTVAGLVTSTDGNAVTGARLRRAGASTDETLSADLVVDASGKGSRLPSWLVDLGYPSPIQQEVQIGMAYLTGLFRMPDGALGDRDAILISPTRDNPRGAVGAPREDGTHYVTVAEYFGDTQNRDLLGQLRTLATPALHDALCGAELVSKPQPYRIPADVRRRYARSRRFPSGLLATGDAVASFNPIFAQGMSVAALEALALRSQLHRYGTDRLASRFFRSADRIIDVAWQAATYNDLYQPAVAGKTPLTRTFNAYLTAVNRACAVDPAVTTVFLSVLGFVRPPTALLRPGFVARVIAANRPGAGHRENPVTAAYD